MKKGFTMIELIFVIVILGILAGFAIPRLVAMRDDAQMSRFAQNLSFLVTDCMAFYISQGKYEKDISNMTNVAVLNKNDFTAELALGNIGCIKIILHNQDDKEQQINRGTLEILPINNSVDHCKEIHEMPIVSNYIKTRKYLVNNSLVN